MGVRREPLDSPRMEAGHQKYTVIRGVDLSAPFTDLWEGEGEGEGEGERLEIKLYKTHKTMRFDEL